MAQTLVSVVIPACNAMATLDETLRSARGQTHRELEIVVVDDGSADATASMVQCHARRDPRVRLISQPNAGVAAARNNGWRQASADLIAFLDADDLWAPTKIERQLQVLHAAGPRVGLVYCWFTRIDRAGRMGSSPEGPRHAGDVLELLFLENFVGNGSSALVRREALLETGGFDTGLRAGDAQGCEDLLFYCRVAEKHHFAVVPEHLVGYRDLPGNMSSDRPRMLRSWMLVAEEMRARHPELSATIGRGLNRYAHWLMGEALATYEYRQCLALVSMHPGAARAVSSAVKDLARRLARRVVCWRRTETPRKPAERFPIGRACP